MKKFNLYQLDVFGKMIKISEIKKPIKEIVEKGDKIDKRKIEGIQTNIQTDDNRTN